MDNKEAAYHRKEHILNESSSRLNNLLKGEHDEVSEEEDSNEHPVKLDSVEPSTCNREHSMKPGSVYLEESDEVVEEGDPNKVRLQGYLEIHLYLFSLLLGAFFCYYRHHEHLTDYYPKFLLNFFKLLKRKGVHKLSDHLSKTWELIPAPKKPKNPETPEQTRMREQKEKLNKAFVKHSTAALRVAAASLLCGLLGYDFAYNLDFFKKWLAKRQS